MFGKAMCSIIYYSFLINHFVYFCAASDTDESLILHPFISWNTLNSETMGYIPNPDVPTLKIPMTSSFVYSKAQELLKSGIDSKTRIGTEFMIRLFTERYGPAIELFDNVCDVRGNTITKSIDTLEKIVTEHFSPKQKRLGGWEEDE